MTYQLVQIPKTTGVVVEVQAQSVSELMAKIKSQSLVDLSLEWLIYENGQSKGFIEHTKYTCAYSDTPEKRAIKRLRDLSKSRYFDTPEEALADRKKFEAQANAKLDEIQEDFKALCAKHNAHISYFMQGDTYGIDEDYMYISIDIEGYNFKRILSE